MNVKNWIRSGLAAGAFCVAAALASLPASAAVVPQPGFNISYTLNNGAFDVSDIVMFEQGQGTSGYGITYPFTGPYSSGTTLTDPFVKYNPIISTFLLGLTSGLPGDAEGQNHLVVFTNDQFALSANHIAFGTLFPSTNEATLIYALQHLDVDQSTDDLFTFAGGDAVDGPNGPIGFGANDTFTALAFSDAQIIGDGISFTTSADVTEVPEPMTLTLLGAGLGGAAAVRRRRKKAA